MISRVIPHSEVTRGLLRVLTPLRLRGESIPFLYTNVKLPPEDKKYLQCGMIMEFSIKHSKAVKARLRTHCEKLELPTIACVNSRGN